MRRAGTRLTSGDEETKRCKDVKTSHEIIHLAVMLYLGFPLSLQKPKTCRSSADGSIAASGPIPAVHGVVRWRLKDLAQWIFEGFRLSVSETS